MKEKKMNWYCVFLGSIDGRLETAWIKASHASVIREDGLVMLKFWIEAKPNTPPHINGDGIVAEFNVANIMGWKYDRPVGEGD